MDSGTRLLSFAILFIAIIQVISGTVSASALGDDIEATLIEWIPTIIFMFFLGGILYFFLSISKTVSH